MDSHEARERVIQLIQEGAELDLADSGQFHRWVERSYQALQPFSPSQQQFDQFCRTSGDTRQMRTYIGLHLLRLTAARIRD